MKRQIITAFIFYLFSSGIFNGEFHGQTAWTLLNQFPETTELVGACSINGKIYCISTDWWSFSKPRTIYEYNPATNSWTRKSSMPDKRAAFVAACVNGKIYVVGGSSKMGGNYSNIVNEYDPAADAWSVKNSMPTARGDGIPSVVFDNKIFVVGGGLGNTISGAVEVYNPALDIWTSYKNLPTPRTFMTILPTQNKLYVVNGFPMGWGDSSGPAQVTEVLNLETNEYELNPVPVFPKQIMETQYASFINGKYYLFCDDGVSGIKRLMEFNPEAGTLTNKKDMITARFGFSQIVVNDKIYVIGGSINSNGTMTDKVECYDPQKDTWTSLANLNRPQMPNLVLCDGKIYAIGNQSFEVYDTKNDPTTKVSEGKLEKSFSLFQNYPNPFNPSTVIAYRMPALDKVELKIFDVLGRELKTLVDKEQDAGNYTVKFDGQNLSSGIYFYRIKTGDFIQTRKMLLEK